VRFAGPAVIAARADATRMSASTRSATRARATPSHRSGDRRGRRDPKIGRSRRRRPDGNNSSRIVSAPGWESRFRRRLVGEHEHGTVGDRACDRDALLLPAGQLLHRELESFLEAEVGEQLLRPLRAPRPRWPAMLSAISTFSRTESAACRLKSWKIAHAEADP
jgi:hypothetical protein